MHAISQPQPRHMFARRGKLCKACTCILLCNRLYALQPTESHAAYLGHDAGKLLTLRLHAASRLSTLHTGIRLSQHQVAQSGDDKQTLNSAVVGTTGTGTWTQTDTLCTLAPDLTAVLHPGHPSKVPAMNNSLHVLLHAWRIQHIVHLTATCACTKTSACL